MGNWSRHCEPAGEIEAVEILFLIAGLSSLSTFDSEGVSSCESESSKSIASFSDRFEFRLVAHETRGEVCCCTIFLLDFETDGEFGETLTDSLTIIDGLSKFGELLPLTVDLQLTCFS